VRWAGALGLTVVFGCSSSGAPTTSDAEAPDASALGCLVCGDATYDVAPFVQVSGELTGVCANADGCHGSGAGMLGLSAGNVFAPLVNVPSWEVPSLLRVKPYDPARSYLYLKLACEGGIEGGCMPLGGTVSPTLLQAFHDWIEAGAAY
jgi:hypothetical protein